MFTLSMCVLIVVALVGCGKKEPTGPKVPATKWTIMGYFAGNNDLDVGNVGLSWAITEAQYMEKVGSTDQIKMLAQISSIKTGGLTRRYYVERKDDYGENFSSKMLEDLGTVDMANPQILKNFVEWAIENYPAQHYMLVIMDHGAGWRGTCVDDLSGAGTMMTMPQMRQALEGKKFDIVAFDACLMAMVEVAYELRDVADYVAASQNVAFAKTFGWQEWLLSLSQNPDMEPYQLCKKICDAGYNAARDRETPLTMSVTDLSKIEGLAAPIDAFAQDLGGIFVDPQAAAQIIDARGKARMMAFMPDFVDLYNFAQNIKQTNLPQAVKNEADDVIGAITAAVPYKKQTVIEPRGGLCIYFPDIQNIYEYQGQVVQMAGYDIEYDRVAFGKDTTWKNFLKVYNTKIHGTLEVKSTPEGAKIFINDVDQDRVTPCTFLNLPPEDYKVKLTLAGYQDWEHTVSVTAGGTTTVNVTLTPVAAPTTGSISGRVTWPGHTLSVNARVEAYSVNLQTGDATFVKDTEVGVNGTYSLTDLTPGPYVLGAYDDLDGNGQIDAGEGLGLYDPNDNGEWDTADIINLKAGDAVTGIDITLASHQPAKPVARRIGFGAIYNLGK